MSYTLVLSQSSQCTELSFGHNILWPSWKKSQLFFFETQMPMFFNSRKLWELSIRTVWNHLQAYTTTKEVIWTLFYFSPYLSDSTVTEFFTSTLKVNYHTFCCLKFVPKYTTAMILPEWKFSEFIFVVTS